MTTHPIFLTAALLALAASGCTQSGDYGAADSSASASQDVVETVYAGFAAGDIALATSVMAADIDWREAQGNPYADKNPYIGPDAVVSGLFARLGGEWDGFTAAPDEFVSEDGRVVVFGRYCGTYVATGKTLDAPFAHSWTVKDGTFVAFQQYTDTAGQLAAMTAGD